MRTAWVLFNLVLWTIIIGLLVILIGLVERSGRAVRGLTRIWARLILAAAGIRYRITGCESVERSRQYIFACNHESALDIPLCFAAIPHHIVSIAKVELRGIPIFGWAMRVAGHIFVDRKDRERAIQSMSEARESLERNPRSILIFPEGTRSLDGEIHEFKKGAAVLSLSVGLPLVPMAICGTGEVIRKKAWKLNPRPVELRLGRPIDASGLEYSDRNRLTTQLREAVLELKAGWQAEQVQS